jgi:dienelactone hydrolase
MSAPLGQFFLFPSFCYIIRVMTSRTNWLLFFLLCLFSLAFSIESVEEERPSKIWDVLLTTKDNKKIRCSYWQPVSEKKVLDARAVILVHELGGRRSDWGQLPELLSQAGFAVLSLELRGHDLDIENRNHWSNFEKKEFNAMVWDLVAAQDWLKKQNKVHIRKIALLGARFGANLALKAMEQEKQVKLAICLSPGFSYRSVKVDPELKALKERPLWFIAAKEDRYSSSCLEVFKNAGANITILEADDGENDWGTDLLLSRKFLTKKIIRYLGEHF